ncbi:hypothetical protein MARGE09_P2496 [Marinagarivorans cellulosilyticus]|uniref:Uncharacterized protein n=1 Tax=Marinagarivorans cellulosilyticus TaxID=2721545 RepID=A0AAN2BKT2_9GAMM|nr:hypothetical protein MARGE09_P2496 [Marinagarivorans cellulosilyticus]
MGDPPVVIKGGPGIEFLGGKIPELLAPINTNPLFNLSVTGIAVSGAHETGKKCCDDCAKGVDPLGYETWTAEAKASASVTAVVPGAGVALAFNKRGFGDLHLGGKLEVGLGGRSIVQIKGDASRETSECNDNGDCAKGGWGLSGTLGVGWLATAQVNCSGLIILRQRWVFGPVWCGIY